MVRAKNITTIPAINLPIQRPDGSMEWVWYLYLQWVVEIENKLASIQGYNKDAIQVLKNINGVFTWVDE